MIKNFLMRKALQVTQSRVADFVIGPEGEKPYLLRWWWIPRNRFFNIYIHVFLQDDEDRALHDHPWPSLSLTARGILKEISYIDQDYFMKTGLGPVKSKLIQEGSWTYRSAKFAHRLEVPTQSISPVTIFITGPKIRKWGFLCPKGWRRWEDFVSSDKPGTAGRGCGEMDQ